MFGSRFLVSFGAKKLSRKEKESISERFSAELRLLSTGEWLIGIWVTMIYEMLLQVLLTVRKLLWLREKAAIKVRFYLNNHQGDHDIILKELWVIGRMKGPRLVILPNTQKGTVMTRNSHGAYTTTCYSY